MNEYRDIYIVDDEPEMCRSLTLLLATGGVPARSFSSADQLLDALDHLTPGIIISDVSMPGRSGIELPGALRERGRGDPVILIAGHADIPLAVTALHAGAVNFIEKPFAADTIRAAVADARRHAVDGEERRHVLDRLSHREQQVLERIVAGMTTKEAARSLSISHRTVETYRAALMGKLGAANMAQLIRTAVDAGIG